jgi:hypothetical protein
MSFPDGWKIVRLLTPEALDRESAHMQHCIGKGAYDHHLDSGDHVFYSLRDPKNLPHATMEAVHEDGIAKLVQCKGKQNAILMGSYFDYTIPFVKERGMEPPEDPHSAGIIKHKGEYYTIYRLPEGYTVPAYLDLGALHSAPVLPGGLKVKGNLYLNAEAAPQIPEDCEIGGNVVFCWKKGGKYHREGGPAIMEIDPQTGVVTDEIWYRDGKRHREGGPAIMEIDPQTGVVTYEIWYRDGKLNREGGPAVIWRDAQTVLVTLEAWLRDDKYHREDGPAYIRRNSNTGEIILREWYLNGEKVTPEQAGDYSFSNKPALEAA